MPLVDNFVHITFKCLLALQIISLYIMAKVQLARRQLAEALASASEAHRRLGDGPVEEWDEHIRLGFVEALRAAGQGEEADEALRTAYEAIRQRAAAMKDEHFRSSYVTRNQEARILLELAQKRLELTL